MRTLRNALLAGAAVAFGFSGAALAQGADTHVMTVPVPGGGVAQITYTGNIPPRVVFGEGAPVLDVFAPMPDLFGTGSPFAMMERISAAMDRQAAAMFRQTEALANPANSPQLTEAALRHLPPGSSSYSFVSTLSGNGVCSESVQITSGGNGSAPRVVRHSSGNCGSASGGPAGSINLPGATPPAAQPGPVWTGVPAPASRPDAVWTSARGAKPYAGLVHEIPPAPQR